LAREVYKARLVESSFLSEPAQCKHFVFEAVGQSKVEFAPGQFYSMLARNGDKTMTRAYSIASAPYGNNVFDLCVNRVEGGFFSNLLCDMDAGAEVDFHGPHGLFVLRKPLRDCVMIATGTGIAPMRAFVQWLYPENGPARDEGRKVWLVYGTRYESELYYSDYFEHVAARNPNFSYVTTLSRGSESWQGARGYVQERVREIVASQPEGGRGSMDAYICGLNDMVSANRKMLTEEFGWDKKQVIFERYD
jgi:ferredoxin-NADP reductase